MEKKRVYYLLVGFVLILALFLRFYHFPRRWGLGGDDARDAAIGREALARRELPLIGSFASAGPFVFGPMFYWFIMLSYFLLPFTVMAPWIINALVAVMTVFVFMICGKLLEGKKLSILVGLMAATSPQFMARSSMLGHHGFIAVTTGLMILCFLLLWREKKLFFAFLMGLNLGVALSMHYQAINLFIFLPGIFLIKSLDFKKKVKALFLMIAGIIPPSLPLLIWDSRQQWANIRNILDYFFIAQYRIYVPNSWRLFLFKYLPDYWGFVVGRYLPTGLVSMILFFLVFLFLFLKRKLSKELIALGIIFSVMLFINRYYRGERSEGYLLYLSPFIIIFTSWTISTLLGRVKARYGLALPLLAGVMIVVILTGNLASFRSLLDFNNGVEAKQKTLDELALTYPEEKFSLYDYDLKSYDTTSALSLLLSGRKKADKEGHPVGIICISEPKLDLPIITSLGRCSILDLQNVLGLGTDKTPWFNLNQESIYEELIGWSKRNELRSPFSLRKFLKL